MSGIVILFLAGLCALAFVVVAMRRKQTARPLRAILLLVAAGIVAYVAWLFLAGTAK
jgi:ABC-type transport system involved in cytochrome c biogenesis permease subunit